MLLTAVIIRDEYVDFDHITRDDIIMATSESEEEHAQENTAADNTESPDEVVSNRPHKMIKAIEDLQRRARRTCVRLASMANRCLWLPATDIDVHILTGGDCVQ